MSFHVQFSIWSTMRLFQFSKAVFNHKILRICFFLSGIERLFLETKCVHTLTINNCCVQFIKYTKMSVSCAHNKCEERFDVDGYFRWLLLILFYLIFFFRSVQTAFANKCAVQSGNNHIVIIVYERFQMATNFFLFIIFYWLPNVM